MSNPYLNPYMMNPFIGNPYLQQTAQQTVPQVQPQPNILPPQQILHADGKASIDSLQMSPNSSVLIIDNNDPIVWMCVSDGLGKVTATPFDVSPHKSEEQIKQDNLTVVVNDMNNRLARVEELLNGKSNVESNGENVTNKADVGNVQKHKQPAENNRTGNGKQESAVQETK